MIKTIVAALLVALSSITLAAQTVRDMPFTQQPATNQTPQCYATLGGNGVSFCVSRYGLLESVRVNGVEHLGVGQVTEGFAVCRSDDWLALRAFHRDAEADTWIAAPQVVSTAPLEFKYFGHNGLRARVTFTYLQAEKALRVATRLYTLGATIPGVRVMRAADLDMDATALDDVAGHSDRSAWAWQGGSLISLTAEAATNRQALVAHQMHLDLYQCSNQDVGSAISGDVTVLATTWVGDVRPGVHHVSSVVYRVQ